MKNSLLFFTLFFPIFFYSQQWEWVRTSSSLAGNQYLNTMASDQSGNIYVLGKNDSTTQFGITILPAGSCLLKFDPSGSLLWARPLSYSPSSIDVDHQGNVFLAGTYSATMNSDNSSFTSLGYDDGFLVKLNANGIEQWARNYANVNNMYIHQVIADNYGNAILTGKYIGDTISFHNQTVFNTNGHWYFFLARINPSGITRWVTNGIPQSDSCRYEDGIGVQMASNNQIFAIGRASVCNGAYCGKNFLAKFDTSGNQIYHKWLPGAYNEGLSQFQLDGLDNIYVYDFKPYFCDYMKFNNNLQLQWNKSASLYFSCWDQGPFDVDPTGKTWMGGRISYWRGSPMPGGCSDTAGIVWVSGHSFYVSGNDLLYNGDLLFSTIDNYGNYSSMSSAGGRNTEGFTSVHVSKTDEIYYTGTINISNNSSLQNDTMLLGTHTIQNNSSYAQGFIAKLGNFNFTGVSKQSIDQNNAYPNPAKDHIIIKTKEGEIRDFTLRDALGNKIMNGIVNSDRMRIDLQDLKTGVYFLELKANDQTNVLKVLKE